LLDANHERFCDELAPRDVVSRAEATTMASQGVDHLWLDATGLDNFAVRFPTIFAALAEVGLDPAVDYLPIAPAAHHISGGVLCDLDGATVLEGLWVAGEAACTGVHGANRLASNSLLEGLVFGSRAAEAIGAGKQTAERSGVLGVGAIPLVEVGAVTGVGCRGEQLAYTGTEGSELSSRGGVGGEVRAMRAELGEAMTAGAGVVRSADSLAGAGQTLERVAGGLAGRSLTAETLELANLITLGSALIDSATRRNETRGAHARREYPEADEAWRLRLVHGRSQLQTATKV
jgi:L-aspartate oxidase